MIGRLCTALASGAGGHVGRELRETIPRHLILRIAWVYSAHGFKFLKTWCDLRASIRLGTNVH